VQSILESFRGRSPCTFSSYCVHGRCPERRALELLDALFGLALVEVARNRDETALVWLARAARRAPRRADVQLLLAETTSSLNYYADSAPAWRRYCEQVPDDDRARRELGFTTALMGQRQQGLVDLTWYLARHAGDAIGHFEAAVALTSLDPGRALLHLNKAIALRPDYAPAYYARGALLYGQNKPEAALADFTFAAGREPENGVILDQLGRTYLALDRPADALAVLRKAAELNPRDSKTLMHLARALSETGQAEEAKQVFARFRALGPNSAKGAPGPGFVELLALPPEQQYQRYRARGERRWRRSERHIRQTPLRETAARR
jgi:tetratricopeptide (TPR) repeat protein